MSENKHYLWYAGLVILATVFSLIVLNTVSMVYAPIQYNLEGYSEAELELSHIDKDNAEETGYLDVSFGNETRELPMFLEEELE